MGTYHKVDKITQLFERDRQALTAMGDCGYLSRDHIHQCGVADGRLKNYIHDDYVKAGDKGLGYQLTDKGKDLLESKWGMDKTYNAQSENHDLAIADKYLALSQYERDTWKNETELREDFENKLEELRDQGQEELAKTYEEMYHDHTISMCDGAYTNSEGIEVYYEIITNNYGEAELMAKEAIVQIMGVEYETQRV